MTNLRENYGSAAMYAGAAVGGAVLASVAQNNVKFLNSTIGRILLVVMAIVVFAKAKSDTLKAVATGVAVSGATSFIRNIAGSINGVDGLFGLEGDGMGQIVQDENGMLYMLNGGGEWEPYQVPMIDNFDDSIVPFAGVGDANSDILFAAA